MLVFPEKVLQPMCNCVAVWILCLSLQDGLFNVRYLSNQMFLNHRNIIDISLSSSASRFACIRIVTTGASTLAFASRTAVA